MEKFSLGERVLRAKQFHSKSSGTTHCGTEESVGLVTRENLH